MERQFKGCQSDYICLADCFTKNTVLVPISHLVPTSDIDSKVIFYLEGMTQQDLSCLVRFRWSIPSFTRVSIRTDQQAASASIFKVQRFRKLNFPLPAGSVAEIAAGGHHTCALLTSGTVVCWGYNGDGELGTGDTIDRYTATAVSGLASGERRGYEWVLWISCLRIMNCIMGNVSCPVEFRIDTDSLAKRKRWFLYLRL